MFMLFNTVGIVYRVRTPLLHAHVAFYVHVMFMFMFLNTVAIVYRVRLAAGADL
jgi:hypothetical protein